MPARTRSTASSRVAVGARHVGDVARSAGRSRRARRRRPGTRALDERDARSLAGRDEVRHVGRVERARARRVAAHDHRARARRSRRRTTRRARRGQRDARAPLACVEVQRLVEQRRADRALLVARELVEALGRGQQRDRGLRRGPREPRREPRPRLATASQPAVADRHARRRASRRARTRARRAALPRVVVGHRPAGALDVAVGVEQQHAGVEHPREPLDHRRARARLAQRVDQVALDRGQPLVGVQVAGEQRAVDEADDVAERRCRAGRRAPGTTARAPPPAARAGRA